MVGDDPNHMGNVDSIQLLHEMYLVYHELIHDMNVVGDAQFLDSYLLDTDYDVLSTDDKQALEGISDLIPSSFMFVSLIQKHVANRPLMVLFDPGSKGSFINKRSILVGATPQLTNPPQHMANVEVMVDYALATASRAM